MSKPSIQPEPDSPYARFLAERDEINKHKWIASQREGRDIGFERALKEWATHHRMTWLSEISDAKKGGGSLT